LREQDIHCLGHLRRVFPLLSRLHEVGCERDRAGNRELFFDDYCKLVLLYIWNPLIESMHDLQQVLGLPRVAKTLGVKRFSVGSFSESVRLFDPRLLEPIVAELAGELLVPATRDPRLGELKHALTLVDGTVLPALARLAKFAAGYDPQSGLSDTRYNTATDGSGMYGWRVHTQLDLQTFHPCRIKRTGARNAGANRENNVLRASLEPGRCYVGDGGYADRSLFDDIADAHSSYVIRTGEHAGSVYQPLEPRMLTRAALDAGVVQDSIVHLPGARHPTRRVELKVQPHPRRTRRAKADGGGFKTKQVDRIILFTNLLQLPAELIALIYQYRYTVELFFRVFKQLLGMRHLLSQRTEGIDIQIYCTLIVCVLIQQIGGKKPNKALRNIIGWYLLGLADEQDVIDFLNKPDNTGVKKRAKDELWKKLGY
jgi:hypothetical protein